MCGWWPWGPGPPFPLHGPRHLCGFTGRERGRSRAAGHVWQKEGGSGETGEGAKGRRPAAEQSGAPAGCGHRGEGGGRPLSTVVSGHGQVWLKGCRSRSRSGLAVFDLAKVGGGGYRTRGWGWPDSVTRAWFPSSRVRGQAHIRGAGTEGHCRVTLGCSYARPAPDWRPCEWVTRRGVALASGMHTWADAGSAEPQPPRVPRPAALCTNAQPGSGPGGLALGGPGHSRRGEQQVLNTRRPPGKDHRRTVEAPWMD